MARIDAREPTAGRAKPALLAHARELAPVNPRLPGVDALIAAWMRDRGVG